MTHLTPSPILPSMAAPKTPTGIPTAKQLRICVELLLNEAQRCDVLMEWTASPQARHAIAWEAMACRLAAAKIDDLLGQAS